VNILVLKPGGLSDVLMVTPLVATLRAAYPEARIDFAVGSRYHSAVVTNPDLNEVIPLFSREGSPERQTAAAVAAALRLRQRRYDLAFCADDSWRVHLATYLAGIPRRFGLQGRRRTPYLTDPVRFEREVHHVDAYLALAERAGLKKFMRRDLKYLPGQGALEHAVQLMKNRAFDALPFRVALCPGGGDAPDETVYHRRWPGERYALLANEMIERYGGGVVLLGDESERELNFLVRNDINHPVLDLTGRLDLEGMGAVMQLCDAVIANDTASMHLAVAVGTPTVGVFGPTSARQTGPYGRRHRAVQSHIWCGPCTGIGGPMEECGAACIQRITVRDLVSVLESRPA